MNDDHDKYLSQSEFKDGIKGFGLDLKDNEIDDLFKIMDRDGSNTICMTEFLRALRVIMSINHIILLLYSATNTR